MSQHDRSGCHNIAIQGLRAQKKPGVDGMLVTAAAEERVIARKALAMMFSSVRFLARQGFPIRGHDHRDGPFYNLMKERAEVDAPEVLNWLKRRDNWMSDTIQNEMIELMALEVWREVMNEVKQSDFVGFVADGTTDVSGMEQFTVCLQYTNVNMESVNEFVGLYNSPDSTGETLTKVIRDVLLRMGVTMDSLSGFSFDTAANMSGKHQGVQARIRQECPHALYVPCANHTLDLVLQEASRDIAIVASAIQFARDAVNVVNESAKRLAIYKAISEESNAQKLVAMCPTRWCIRAKALKRITDNYGQLRSTLQRIMADSSVRGSIRAKVNGLYHKASEDSTFIALYVLHDIFSVCEEVATSLQAASCTSRGALEAVSLLRAALAKMRADGLSRQLSTAVQQAERLDLEQREPRSTSTPGRIRDDGVASPDAVLSPLTKVRQAMLEALDVMLRALDERFVSDGLKIASQREEVFLSVLGSGSALGDQNMLHLPPSIAVDKLKAQLAVFSGAFDDDGQPLTLHAAARKLACLDSASKKMLSEVRKFLSLLLSQPSTVASAERSFSYLRRLKTWTRSTISQARLTHLALLHVHSERTGAISLEKMAAEFVRRSQERMAVFGAP